MKNFGRKPRRFNDEPRKMHKAKCTECGAECEAETSFVKIVSEKNLKQDFKYKNENNENS